MPGDETSIRYDQTIAHVMYTHAPYYTSTRGKETLDAMNSDASVKGRVPSAVTARSENNTDRSSADITQPMQHEHETTHAMVTETIVGTADRLPDSG